MSSNAKTKTKAKTKVVTFDAVNSAKFEKGGNGNDEEASMTPAATDGARYFSGTKDAKGGDLTRREEVLLTAKQDRFNVEKSGTANKIKLEREKKDALMKRAIQQDADEHECHSEWRDRKLKTAEKTTRTVRAIQDEFTADAMQHVNEGIESAYRHEADIGDTFFAGAGDGRALSGMPGSGISAVSIALIDSHRRKTERKLAIEADSRAMKNRHAQEMKDRILEESSACIQCETNKQEIERWTTAKLTEVRLREQEYFEESAKNQKLILEEEHRYVEGVAAGKADASLNGTAMNLGGICNGNANYAGDAASV